MRVFEERELGGLRHLNSTLSFLAGRLYVLSAEHQKRSVRSVFHLGAALGSADGAALCTVSHGFPVLAPVFQGQFCIFATDLRAILRFILLTF